MEVILLEKIRNLGVLGDKVKVRPGYARNFLIPQGKAVFANEVNITKFEQRRAELEKIAEKKLATAMARQEIINAMEPIVISAKAGDEGKLFGSITSRDIAKALHDAKADIEKREIRMPEGSLRMIGEYEVVIELDSDVTATIKIHIVPEG